MNFEEIPKDLEPGVVEALVKDMMFRLQLQTEDLLFRGPNVRTLIKGEDYREVECDDKQGRSMEDA